MVISALLNVSCANKVENSEREKLSDARSKYIEERLLKKGDEEFIVLLSIKYNLPVDLTRKILSEFQKHTLDKLLFLSDVKTVEEFEQLKAEMEKPPIEERIKKLSIENNISQSLIASLLVDYEIWRVSYRYERYE